MLSSLCHKKKSKEQSENNWQIYDRNHYIVYSGIAVIYLLVFRLMLLFLWQSELNISLVFVLFESHKQPYIPSEEVDYDNCYKKSQETMVFSGCQKLTSAMKLRTEKWWYISNLMLYTGKYS